MTRAAVRIRTGRWAVAAGVWLILGVHDVAAHLVYAQVPGTGEGSEPTADAGPIRCWWKSANSAVYVGERFPLTLTCGVVETEGIRVVPDYAKLDPAAVQLPPFDVVEGTRRPDIVAGQNRFFQYEYVLRVIADDLFGRVVTISAFDVHYRIQNASADQPSVESMERIYRLPALPVRVMTLVSPESIDIRDAIPDSFADVESRRFRGNLGLAMAALLFTAAFGCLVVAGGGVVRRYRTPAALAGPVLSEQDILRGVTDELHAVQKELAHDGWNRDRAGRALAAVRVGIAIALGYPTPQAVVSEDAPAREGALRLRIGGIRPKRVMVFSSVTADALNPVLASGSGDPDRPVLSADALPGGVDAALALFTTARYGRDELMAPEQLDRALADAVAMFDRLRASRSRFTRASDAMRTFTRRG